jgi:thioredoxin reductase (NADPH)
MEEPKNYDAIIFGGGPAGISCALELHELRVNHVLIDKNPRLGGQLSEIQNTIRTFAARFWESGLALREDMEALCQKIGITSELSEPISKVDLQNKMLFGAKHIYKGKAVFLATGTRTRTLAIPGSELFVDNILYSVSGNEDRLAGKTVAVIGGGDNAFMDSLSLAQRGSAVLLINRSDHFKARPDVIADVLKNPRIKIFEHTSVISVAGQQGKLSEITMEDRLTQKTFTQRVDYLVIRIGFAPNSELFADQLKTDDQGLLIIDQSCKTTMDGVFAGGDLVSPDVFGIARSVGHGMVAGRAMLEYLAGQKLIERASS